MAKREAVQHFVCYLCGCKKRKYVEDRDYIPLYRCTISDCDEHKYICRVPNSCSFKREHALRNLKIDYKNCLSKEES